MAKGKGGEGGYGEGDNVHSGSGSKSGGAGYSLPKGKAEGNAVGGKDTTFAKGGDTHMFGEQNADAQKSSKEGGGTAHDTGNDQNDGPGRQVRVRWFRQDVRLQSLRAGAFWHYERPINGRVFNQRPGHRSASGRVA